MRLRLACTRDQAGEADRAVRQYRPDWIPTPPPRCATSERPMEAASSIASPDPPESAMGLVGLLAAVLSSTPGLRAHWLGIWLLAAAVAASLGTALVARPSSLRGLTLSGTPIRKLALCLIPSSWYETRRSCDTSPICSVMLSAPLPAVRPPNRQAIPAAMHITLARGTARRNVDVEHSARFDRLCLIPRCSRGAVTDGCTLDLRGNLHADSPAQWLADYTGIDRPACTPARAHHARQHGR